MNLTHVAVLLAYVALMLAIGLWFARGKNTSTGEDFVLAGRSLPAWVLGGTMLATFVGSGSVIGGANFAYTYGLLPGLLFFSGTVVGTFVMVALARRVRVLSTHTIPELFEMRYNRAVRVVGTVIILVAFIGITAYQFTGAGYIFSLITPLSEDTGAILAALLITFLAMTGGLKSVAWSDALSSLLIVFALWVAVFIVVGVDVGTDNLGALGTVGEEGTFGGLTGLQMFSYILPVFVLLLGDQNMYQRLGAAKNERAAFTGAMIFAGGSIIMVTPVVLLAVSSAVLQPGIEADLAVLSLSDQQFTPGLVGGALLAGAFALIVTTGSSYLLTCSSNIVHDLVGQLRRDNPPSDRANLWIGRVAVLAIAVLGFVMVNFFPNVLALQMYAYTMYGAAITPVVLAAVFWKRATAPGALAGMIAGGVATLAWEITGSTDIVQSVMIALPVAVLTMVVVSLLTTPDRRSAETLDDAEHAAEEEVRRNRATEAQAND
ncbi:MAG: sodium:solute symporter family protein [Mobilicoccus sp.]|nr:sodium:solute symporter family protein [Mobilicoccus sp.]